MPMNKVCIDEVGLAGKRVLIRVDFNVPLERGRVTDDTRIRESLPTIRYARNQGARVILCSHLGRPKGKPSPELSLRPVAARLSELLGEPVGMAEDCVGETVHEAIAKLRPGEVLLLENLRFHPEEEANDAGFAKQLAELGDAVVEGRDIGTVVARHDNGIGDDFALVSIKPALYPWVSATTAAVGGPCGEYYGSGPETVWHYGHGLAIGTGGTPRGGLALTWKADAFGWDGLAIFGDSGSPVRVTDLKAAGDLTHLVVDVRWLPSFIAGTRIGKMLQIASGWSLASSTLCL